MIVGSDIRIRRADRGDFEPLTRLWLEFHQEQQVREPRLRLATDVEARWRNDLHFWLGAEARCLLVAEGRGRVVGFASAQRWSSPAIYAPVLEVYLDELFVLEEVRRCGIGSRLFQGIRAWAEQIGAGRIRFGVLAGSKEARAFWISQGATTEFLGMAVELEVDAG